MGKLNGVPGLENCQPGTPVAVWAHAEREWEQKGIAKNTTWQRRRSIRAHLELLGPDGEVQVVDDLLASIGSAQSWAEALHEDLKDKISADVTRETLLRYRDTWIKAVTGYARWVQQSGVQPPGTEWPSDASADRGHQSKPAGSGGTATRPVTGRAPAAPSAGAFDVDAPDGWVHITASLRDGALHLVVPRDLTAAERSLLLALLDANVTPA